LLEFGRLSFVVAANDSKPTQSSNDDLERDPPGPDPVLGVGLVILGVFIMGVAGAATAHYIFNLGTLIAIVGAVIFVAFVTLSTYRQTRS
jgi:hypothetical protein